MTTYWDYIKVESLLALQNGVDEGEAEVGPDELTFIIVHQIDELWFKLILRELGAVRDELCAPPIPEQRMSTVVRRLRRASAAVHQLVGHFALMETLTTRDYLGFRGKLKNASGFQSPQLREIELLLGLEDAQRVELGGTSYAQALRHPDGSPSFASERVEARKADRPYILELVEEWLFRTPIDGSLPSDAGDDEAIEAFTAAYLQAYEAELPDARRKKDGAGAREFLLAQDQPQAQRSRRRRIRAAILFIESYRELPLLAWPRELLDGLVQFEQAFLIFRQRHARMVERIIGRRPGTGGSSGVDYLDQTALRYRVFVDLWAARTFLVQQSALPRLTQAGYYDFVEPGRVDGN